MKKKFNKRLSVVIAILLTTIMLLVSGGTMILICLLGSTSLTIIPNLLITNNKSKEKNINQQLINLDINKNDSKKETKLIYDISELNLSKENDNLSKPKTTNKNENNIKKYEETNKVKINEILPKIETIKQLNEEEKTKPLIRKRKKDKVKNNI